MREMTFTREAYALKALLDDGAFQQLVLREVATNRVDPIESAAALAEAFLVRRGTPRERAQFVAVAFVSGFVRGAAIMALPDPFGPKQAGRSGD